MRIFKGLENIHAVIDRHEAEWRRENGELPELSTPEGIVRTVKSKISEINRQFDELDDSRSLHKNPEPPKQEKTEEPEIMPEQPKAGRVQFSEDRFFGGNTEPFIQEASHEDDTTAPEIEADNEPEAVEIIKNKEGRHSWLYNEVMKAINDASKGSGTKIIAVFIPVVQNGKEFETLPADETITISPIDEDLAKTESSEPESTPEPETPAEDFNLIPEIHPEQKAEIEETFREMEEKLGEETQEEESEAVTEDSAPEVSSDEPETEIAADNEPELIQEEEPESLPEEPEAVTLSEEAEIVPEEIDPDTVTEEIGEEPVNLAQKSELEDEIILEEPALEIITETETEDDTLPQEAEELPDTAAEEVEPETIAPAEPEITAEEHEPEAAAEESETEYDNDDNDILQDGEPMDFEDIETAAQNDTEQEEELTLNDELDDDEIFDESLTEVHKPDDEKALIVDENGNFIPIEDANEEIEILPDPAR